jgi:hypothetical protein
MVRRAMLCVGMCFLTTCSEGPTSPTMRIDCREAGKVLIPVVDARERLAKGFEGQTRLDLVIALTQLEASLRECDGSATAANLALTYAILEPFRKQGFTRVGPDVSAIDLALDAVYRVLAPAS